MTIKIDENLVKHVAELARLEMAQDELAGYQKNLKNILGHIEELDKVNTNGVKAFLSPLQEFPDFYRKNPRLHQDKVKQSLKVESLMQNAPDYQANQFKVDAYWESES